MANPFDQFDAQENPFDQFDTGPISTITGQPEEGQLPTPGGPIIPQESVIGRIGESISSRAENFKQFLERQEQKEQEGGILERGAGTLGTAIGAGAVGAGQVVGAALDIPTTIVGEAVKRIPRSEGKSLIPELLRSKVGQKGIEAVKNWQQQYPDAALALDSLVNITALSGGRAGAGAVKQEAKAIAQDISTVAGKAFPKAIDSKIQSVVNNGISKSIRPSVVGKRTFGQVENYYKKAKQAVNTIIENKNNLKLTNDFGETVQTLPENLKQFSQALDQTKTSIYRQYNDLARQAGQGGATVNLEPIVQELKVVSQSPSLIDRSPSLAKSIDDYANRLAERRFYTAEEAQNIIKSFNSSLESFYARPGYEEATQAGVDALVANRIRKSLDDSIQQATGQEYQALKNKYSALKSIERDLNRRLLVDQRANTKSLLDFSDIFSGAEVVKGIVSQDPAMLAAGATAKGIKRYIKKLNDPNKAVKNMFEQVDKLSRRHRKLTEPFVPESGAGLTILDYTGKYKRGELTPLQTAAYEELKRRGKI